VGLAQQRRGDPRRSPGFWRVGCSLPERVEAYLQSIRLAQALRSDKTRWPDTPVEEVIRAARAAPAAVTILPLTLQIETPVAQADGKAQEPVPFWPRVSAELPGLRVFPSSCRASLSLLPLRLRCWPVPRTSCGVRNGFRRYSANSVQSC